jgi:hypothetical protein
MGDDLDAVVAQRRRHVAKLRAQIERDERKLVTLLTRVGRAKADVRAQQRELEEMRVALERRREELAELLRPL